MLITPSDHYALHETVATSAVELKAFIDKVSEIADAKDCDVYWRGQADHRWAVQSSLARLTGRPTALKDSDLEAAEADLLSEARRWVTVTAAAALPAYDLEWLALLQHHGIPTRLIDFTSKALVATFFAVESLDDVEGRLFAVAVPRDSHVVTAADAPTFRVGELGLGELRLWTPTSAVSPRLAAQDGAFAIGRLPSTKPARHIQDAQLDLERLMTRSEVVSVMSIPLYFVSTDRGRNRAATTTYPSCFTARVHVDKSSVREQLACKTGRGALRPAGDAIDYASCYPDIDGLRLYSLTLERVERGLG